MRSTPGRRGAGSDNGRVLRRRLLGWSAVPVFLVLCAAAKLLSLDVLAGRAVAGFAAGDSAAVAAAAGGLSLANAVESHKAPFAAGDGRALAGDYDGARRLFQDALAKVPRGSVDECFVRVNLSLATEKLGDAAADGRAASSAAALYAEALAVVEAAPPGCFSGAAADSGERLSTAEQRLDGKLSAAGPAADPDEAAEDEAPADEDTARQSQLEQLEESTRQAQRERNAGREREEYLGDNDSGAGVDRPW